MPEVPPEMFVEACKTVVRDNMAYVPPYGSNGALYLRPVLFGSGPRIGLQPADEYTFLIMAIPVGDYYKGGLAPVPAVVISDFDRAAPRGVGGVKVAGNYAADLLPNMLGKKMGYPIGLYLDSKTRSFIEEFSTSNFVGFKDNGKTLVTPKSDSVLPSITNKSLMQLARDEGMKVEQREVPVTELAEFEEVVACGTAVVVTPVGKILVGDKVYNYGSDVGKTTMKLYNRVRGIQNGVQEDKFGWNVKV
jgi:branched-chain amino acid aminotransferase